MLRTFQHGDEYPFITAWNASLPADGMSEQIFMQRILLDPNFDPQGIFVIEEEGQIAGGLIALIRRLPLAGSDLEPDNGWITAFFVHPQYRRRGFGHRLLRAADDYFQRLHRRTVSFASYAPNYFVPGVDRNQYPEGHKLLEDFGYRPRYQAVAMDKNLVGFQVPPDVRKLEDIRQDEGYVIEQLTLPFVADTLAFIDHEFDPDWTRAIRYALTTGVSLSQILIARHNTQVTGFCLYGGYGSVGERFGPFGVAQSARGTGLGKILLYRCLEQMQRQGLHNAWFLWTGENEPAGQLYLRAGFSITRRFDVMAKTL